MATIVIVFLCIFLLSIVLFLAAYFFSSVKESIRDNCFIASMLLAISSLLFGVPFGTNHQFYKVRVPAYTAIVRTPDKAIVIADHLTRHFTDHESYITLDSTNVRIAVSYNNFGARTDDEYIFSVSELKFMKWRNDD